MRIVKLGPAYQRGSILYQQHRYAQAADEFRKKNSRKTPTASEAAKRFFVPLAEPHEQIQGCPRNRAPSCRVRSAIRLRSLRPRLHHRRSRFATRPKTPLATLHAKSPRHGLPPQIAKGPTLSHGSPAPSTPKPRFPLPDVRDRIRSSAPQEGLGMGRQRPPGQSPPRPLRHPALRLARKSSGGDKQTIWVAIVPPGSTTHAASGWTHLQSGDFPIVGSNDFTESITPQKLIRRSQCPQRRLICRTPLHANQLCLNPP